MSLMGRCRCCGAEGEGHRLKGRFLCEKCYRAAVGYTLSSRIITARTPHRHIKPSLNTYDEYEDMGDDFGAGYPV